MIEYGALVGWLCITINHNTRREKCPSATFSTSSGVSTMRNWLLITWPCVTVYCKGFVLHWRLPVTQTCGIIYCLTSSTVLMGNRVVFSVTRCLEWYSPWEPSLKVFSPYFETWNSTSVFTRAGSWTGSWGFAPRLSLPSGFWPSGVTIKIYHAFLVFLYLFTVILFG